MKHSERHRCITRALMAQQDDGTGYILLRYWALLQSHARCRSQRSIDGQTGLVEAGWRLAGLRDLS